MKPTSLSVISNDSYKAQAFIRAFTVFMLVLLYSSRTVFVGGYTVFTLSDPVSVCNVLFPSNLKESLMEFHQTLQTHSYIQDKYL